MIFYTAILIWLYMTFWYGLSIIKKRNDIADVAWGLGFILVVIFNYFSNPSLNLLLSIILISIWGLRLSSHIYKRNKNKKEDVRYLQFKDMPYFKVFITQGFFMWLICWPIIFSSKSPFIFILFGILIWLLGFYFEATADKQLKEFINNPKNNGKIMKTGLWSLSRHPNYFGEVVMWWGIWMININQNFWSIIGPLTITILILKVSGVPMLEKKYEGNLEFEEYKKTVPVFFPKFYK